MTRSHQDVENLFASQGISGRYRELARHPAPSADKAKKAAEPESKKGISESDASANATVSEHGDESSLKFSATPDPVVATPPRRGLARLGLVMPAPKAPQGSNRTERPLGEVFSRLSKTEADGTPTTQATHRSGEQQSLRQLRLPALFAHLERNGNRR